MGRKLNSDKVIPIVLVGIQQAGKTTLARLLAKGRPVLTTLPTTGLDIEIAHHKDNLYQLFDLGGQYAFRATLWERYVELATGIVFVFDAADRSTISDAIEWFWKVVSWAPPRAPLLFLANKCDLPSHMDLSEIIQHIDAKRVALSGRSFRIFSISAKSGENVQMAFEWLSESVRAFLEQKNTHMYFLLISSLDGEILAEIDARALHLVGFDASNHYTTALHSFVRAASQQIGLESLETGFFRLVIVRGSKIVCLVGVRQDDPEDRARLIAESCLGFVEKLYREENVVNLSEKLLTYLNQAFPKDLDF
ncbi:MAG: ADP-ribosylation factor-like protein [Candidatus Hodarchaeota archaeon]